MYRIKIFLPSSRVPPGWLHLIGGLGQLIESFPCLGKADNERALAKGNPSRDPVRPFGDTPTGLYLPTKVERFSGTHERIGLAWIPMVGGGRANDQAATACAPGKMQRTGLGIHAGRDGSKLFPTYGCIRMLTGDFNDLIATIGDEMVQIEVENL